MMNYLIPDSQMEHSELASLDLPCSCATYVVTVRSYLARHCCTMPAGEQSLGGHEDLSSVAACSYSEEAGPASSQATWEALCLEGGIDLESQL